MRKLAPTLSHNRHIVFSAVIVLFGLAGAVLLLQSNAAIGPQISLEAETSNSVGNTRVQVGTNVSGESYATMHTTTGGTLCTTELKLADALQSRGITLGGAVHNGALTDNVFAGALACEYRGAVAENFMKWDELQNPIGTFHFEEADRLVAFAQDNNLLLRGHVLVWHNQSSSIQALACNRTSYLQALKTHIETVLGRYGGKIAQWDVVNEALNEDGSMRNTFWKTCIGDDYIEQAFTLARAADPTAKLYYNDFNLHYPGPKLTAAKALVADLKTKGLLDGVGSQSHLIPQLWNFSAQEYRTALQELGSLGVDIAITELDVGIASDSEADLAMQADIYKAVLQSCLEVARCKTIVTWGVSDNHSWVPTTFPPYAAPLLLDTTYRPKPAYTALLELAQQIE